MPDHRCNTRRVVCIGIPTCNRANHLERALVSVQEQTYKNLSIIICDNASADGTEALCKDFATLDTRIQYYRNTSNIGAAANFDEALSHSDAEYFMWLADDDWIDPNYVDRCLECLERNPEAVIAYGAPKYYRDGGFICDGVRLSLAHHSPWWRVLLYYWHIRDNGMFYGVIRRKVLQDVRLHNSFGGDWLLMSDLISQGHALLVPETSIHRSLGGMSVTSDSLVSMISNAGLFERVFPYAGLALFAARNILNGRAGLREVSLIGRSALATTVFWIICLRKGLPNWLGNHGHQLRVLLRRLTHRVSDSGFKR